eukprot:3176584-Rhodomonas_salina.1
MRFPAQCPVLTECMVLRACYAMSGTDLGCAATVRGGLVYYPSRSSGTNPDRPAQYKPLSPSATNPDPPTQYKCLLLRSSPGTDLAYAPTAFSGRSVRSCGVRY